jgi:hypothetical protein
VEWSGGSLADFLAYLQKLPDINIIVQGDATKVKMGEIRLNQVTLPTALSAVGAVIDVSAASMSVTPLGSGIGRKVYVVCVFPNKPASPAAGDPTEFRVFSLKNLTEPMPGDPDNSGLTMKSDTVLTAIDTALAVGGEPEQRKAVVKYHTDSGLLFVRGTDVQLALIAQVLDRMEESVRMRRAALQTSSSALLKKLRDEIDQLKAELQDVKKVKPK